MSSEITDWLSHSPRIDWKTEFNYMLDTLTYEAALKNTSSLSMFIQGLNMEFREKNAAKAIQYYNEGASRLDPLCLCRLHDIYLGDEFLKIEFNSNKALVYLVFAGIYSQDILFEGAVVPFKKLKAFLNQFDPQCKMLQNALRLTKIEAIDPMKNLTICLLFDFQGISQNEQRDNFLNIFEQLPLKIQKEIMYTIYLNEFRLPWEHVVKKKEALVLKLMQDPEIFSRFFESYRGLILMAAANKTLALKFRIWIQSVLFVIEFAALSPQKHKYYKTLMPFIMYAIEKDFFDGRDLICWLRYFLAYCYEKGIYVSKSLEKAEKLIEQNIEESPEGVKYPLRQALLLKQINRIKESKEVIGIFEQILEKRLNQQENSLLYYAKAKSFEKYYGDINSAINFYKKGAAKLPEEVSQNTFFFYSYWRVRCMKRLDKLKDRVKNEQVVSLPKPITPVRTIEIKQNHQPHQTNHNSNSYNKNDSIEREPQSLSPFLKSDSPMIQETYKQSKEIKPADGFKKESKLITPENRGTSTQWTPSQGRVSTTTTNSTGEKEIHTRAFYQTPSLVYEETVSHKHTISNKNKGKEVKNSPEILIDSNFQERKTMEKTSKISNEYIHKAAENENIVSNGYPKKFDSQLLEESKSLFEKMKVPVLSKDSVNISSMKANNSTIAVANDTIYHVEEVELNHLVNLRKDERSFMEIFITKNPKIVPPKAVHIKEKSDKIAVYFLTPLPQLELGGAIQAAMISDLKTKLHVAMQIAICLIQIHDEHHIGFYGSLKPNKIILDEYFGVKIYSPHSGIIDYQNIEPDGYFAPEQLNGKHGKHSDTWAFGVILWELIYSEKVTKDKSTIRSLYKGANLDKEVKGKKLMAQDLINRMISLETFERPSMKEVYEELKAIYRKIPLK